MFNKQELLEYEEDFIKIGITSKDNQKTILEFFYTLGTVLCNLQ